MTTEDREEAIKVLSNRETNNPRYDEFIKMGIEALREEFCDHCKYENLDEFQDPCYSCKRSHKDYYQI